MSGLARALAHRILSLFRRRRLDHDFRDELAAHLDFAVEDHIRAGLSPDDARRRAMMRLGGIESTRERQRDARGLPALESVARDVVHACRTLRRHTGFAAMAVVILALGIGGTTAIFSLVSTVLLRPLPFEAPDRLVVLWEDIAATGASGALSRVEPAPANFVEWKARSRSIVDMAALERRIYNLTGGGEPEKLVGLRATGNLFSLLGLRPVVGRVFTPDDERAQGEPVAVVAEALWRQRFGADPTLVGRTIRLNGLAHTVVGVVPGSFRFPDHAATIWVAASFTPAELASRSAHWYVVGRLDTRVALSEAQSEMTAIAKRMAEDHRASNDGVGVTLTSLHDQLAGHAETALLILQGAVGLVLLIACANVASLVVARGAGRRKELVLRQILGASRARLFRLLLTESVVLGGLGAVLGVGLCATSFAYLVRLVPDMLPQGSAPALDVRVLTFTTLVSSLAVLLSGAGPLLAVVRVDVSQTLRAGGGRGPRADACDRDSSSRRSR
jgi:predicted permease